MSGISQAQGQQSSKAKLDRMIGDLDSLVFVASKPRWKAETDGSNVSANFVKTDGHYIIVAYGKDGVKILKRTDNGNWK